MKSVNLGKRLKVGDTFLSTTKKMIRPYSLGPYRSWPSSFLHYEVLRINEERFFTKGKRRYYCRVIALVETRTGYNAWSTSQYGQNKELEYHERGPRWYMFTYLVRVLEN